MSDALKRAKAKYYQKIKDDPNYQRIALDTPEKKAWFKDLTYRLWDRQITTNQFMSEGLSKYPDRQYEFNFVASFDMAPNSGESSYYSFICYYRTQSIH